jgi:hypothetical protein
MGLTPFAAGHVLSDFAGKTTKSRGRASKLSVTADGCFTSEALNRIMKFSMVSSIDLNAHLRSGTMDMTPAPSRLFLT